MTGFRLTGGCNCGAVRYEVTAPLVSASYCHCRRCQRRSGAAASANAHPAQGAFRIVAGRDRLRVWKPDDGGEKWFCGECGSSLFARNPAHPQSIGIRMGSFDGDPGVRPSVRQFVASAAPWEPLPDDGLPRYAGSRHAPDDDGATATDATGGTLRGAGVADARAARQLVEGLSDAAWALAAVSACAEYQLLEALDEPARADMLAVSSGLPVEVATRLLDVGVALGLVRRDGDVYALSPGAAQATALFPGVLRAAGRATLLQVHDLYRRGRARSLATTGWHHADPDLLEGQGVASAGVVPGFQHVLVPQLTGLEERLAAPGAAFLDVGAGVGGLSIAFARAFPAVRGVALEPADAPFALAREHIERAGLAGRIELRRQRVEALEDVERFDLVWLPVPFVSPDVLPVALERVWQALRPGGWLLLATADTDGPDLRSAIAALRCTLWGERRWPRRCWTPFSWTPASRRCGRARPWRCRGRRRGRASRRQPSHAKADRESRSACVLHLPVRSRARRPVLPPVRADAEGPDHSMRTHPTGRAAPAIAVRCAS